MKPRISLVSSAVTSDSSNTDGLGRQRVYVVRSTHSGPPPPRLVTTSASSSSLALAASARAASALASLSERGTEARAASARAWQGCG